jgi:hypothetical protein
MKLFGEEKKMREEVLAYVHLGMDIEEARVTMEKNGFKCAFGREWDALDGKKAEFCLVCSQFIPPKNWLDGFICSTEIKAFLLFEKGQVTEVRVKTYSTCL